MSAWSTWPPSPPAAALTNAAVVSALYATGSKPLWVPPTVAGPDDDEFDSTDSAALLAKYIFRDRTANVNRTPTFGSFDETVDITGLTSVPKVMLHTQGRASHMLVQTTITGPVTYSIMKRMTWVAGRYYWTRCSTFVRGRNRTPSSSSFPQLVMTADSGGLPDFANAISIDYDLNGTGTLGGVPCARYTNITGGSVSNGTVPISEGHGLQPYFLLANPANVLGASSQWYGEIFSDDGLRLLPGDIGGFLNPFTPAWIGWHYAQTMQKPGVMDVDLVRSTVGHPLLHIGAG